MELANLQFAVESRQVDEAGRSLDQLAQKADKAQRATDGLSGGSKRLSGATAQMLQSIEASVRELVALQRAQQEFNLGLAEGAAAAIREAKALDTASGSMKGYAASSSQAVAAQRTLQTSHVRLADTQKVAAQAGLNLSRQLADVAVMASMGASPFQVLITQGPQLADGMALAAQSGVGLRGALGGIVSQFAPLVRAVGPAIVAVGAVAATAALVADRMNDVKDEGVKTGDVLKATFQVTGRAIWDSIGPTMTKVGDAIVTALQRALAVAKEVIIGISGGFIGAYNGIKATWSMLPAVLGGAAINAANAVIGAAEKMLNSIIRRVNSIIAAVNVAARLFNMGEIGSIPEAQLEPLRGGGSAAGQAFVSAFSDAMREGQESARGAVDGFFKAIDEQARKNARDRKAKEAATGPRGGRAAADNGIEVVPIELVQAKEAISAIVAVTVKGVDGLTSMEGKIRDISDALEQARIEQSFQRAVERAEGLQWTITGIYDSLANRDWFGAIGGLISAIERVKEAWATGGTMGKVGAVAGIAGGIGQAIGGTAGAGISGAASGAMAAVGLGSALKIGALAGPWGIAAGAIIGGIMGLLGGSKAQKAEKEARRRQEAEAKAQRAAETARQARELEVALAEATNDVLAKLNAERAAFMEGIAAENAALAERTYALAQAKAAQEAYDGLFLTEQERLVGVAAQVGDGFKSLGLNAVTSMAEFKALADSLDRTTTSGQQLFAGLMQLGPAFAQVAGYIGSLQGAAAALTPYQAAQGAVSAAEAKVEAARQALQRAIQAEVQSNNEAAQSAQTLAQRFRAVADSLAAYGRRLAESANMLDPRQALARTRADFNRVAGSRDPEVLAQMQAVAEPFLEAARRAAPDAATYARDLAKVRVAVDQAQRFAGKEASAAEATAVQLRAANDNLQRVDESVLSVADAQMQLAAAEAELAAAQAVFENEQIKLLQQIRDALVAGSPGAANDNAVWTATGYLAKNADVQKHWDDGIPQRNGFTNIHEWAWNHWNTVGRDKEGRSFATGGSFTVGGSGGPDSQFMPLWLTPGEQVDIRRPGDGAEVQAELRQLREQVRELGVSLNAALTSVAQHTGKMSRKLEGFEDQGMPVRGATPGAPVQTEVAA